MQASMQEIKSSNSRHFLEEESKVGGEGLLVKILISYISNSKALKVLSSAGNMRGKRGERPLSQCNGNDPINLDSRVFYQASYKWSPPIGHIVACQTQAGTALYLYSSITTLQDIRN